MCVCALDFCPSFFYAVQPTTKLARMLAPTNALIKTAVQ